MLRSQNKSFVYLWFNNNTSDNSPGDCDGIRICDRPNSTAAEIINDTEQDEFEPSESSGEFSVIGTVSDAEEVEIEECTVAYPQNKQDKNDQRNNDISSLENSDGAEIEDPGNAGSDPIDVIITYRSRITLEDLDELQELGIKIDYRYKSGYAIEADVTENALKILTLSNRIESIEEVKDEFYPDVEPDDDYFDQMWNLHNTESNPGTADSDIDAPEAWDIATGRSDIVIAIIDTGIDYNHPDLEDNSWTNPVDVEGDANSDNYPGVYNTDDDGDGGIKNPCSTDCYPLVSQLP